MSENAMDLHAIGFREGAAHMHKALAARIANLEAALREISTLTWTPTDRETYQDLFAEAQNIADAALTAQEKDAQP